MQTLLLLTQLVVLITCVDAQNNAGISRGIGSFFSGAKSLIKNIFKGQEQKADDIGGKLEALAHASKSEIIADQLQHATELVINGNFTAAFEQLFLVYEEYPDHVECQSKLGALLLATRQYDAAENILFSACQLSGWSIPGIIVNLATVLKEKNELDMSLQVLKKGLETARDADLDGALSVAIADILFENHNYSSAADWYLVACFKQPKNVDLWVQASTMNFPSSGRDLKFAENVLIQAIEINNGQAILFYNLGLVMHMKNQFEEAILFYREALRADPEFKSTFSALATALHATGNFADAIPLYENALKFEAHNVVVLSNYALLLNSVGRALEGREHALRALQLDPSSQDAATAYAECLASLPRQ